MARQGETPHWFWLALQAQPYVDSQGISELYARHDLRQLSEDASHRQVDCELHAVDVERETQGETTHIEPLRCHWQPVSSSHLFWAIPPHGFTLHIPLMVFQ